MYSVGEEFHIPTSDSYSLNHTLQSISQYLRTFLIHNRSFLVDAALYMNTHQDLVLQSDCNWRNTCLRIYEAALF